MRRKGVSPWLKAARQQITTSASLGVANRIADGESPMAAWRIERCMTINKLSKLTEIDGMRLISIESHGSHATPDEIASIAVALMVSPGLLAAGQA